MKDLKLVYQAISKKATKKALMQLKEKWGKKYPIVIQSWKNKWENLSAYFLTESASTRNTLKILEELFIPIASLSLFIDSLVLEK